MISPCPGLGQAAGHPLPPPVHGGDMDGRHQRVVQGPAPEGDDAGLQQPCLVQRHDLVAEAAQRQWRSLRDNRGRETA